MEALKTILYFSIFRHPLKIEEIHSFTTHKNLSETEKEINVLTEKNILNKIDEFYVYNNDLDSVSKRIKGNLGAQKVMGIAENRSRFISKFPFVKAVGISGSLSKGYYDEDSDVDFFVITEPNRLWLTRTILMLYKKIFLLNSRKYFCINYFITTDNLQIEEKNRFTATEIKTLIPLYGKKVFMDFYEANNWINTFFKTEESKTKDIQEIKKPFLILVLQSFLRIPLWSFIDDFFQKITVSAWKIKFKKMPKEEFKIALKSTKNISKHHPSNFQKRVMMALNKKYNDFNFKYNIELKEEYV